MVSPHRESAMWWFHAFHLPLLLAGMNFAENTENYICWWKNFSNLIKISFEMHTWGSNWQSNIGSGNMWLGAIKQQTIFAIPTQVDWIIRKEYHKNTFLKKLWNIFKRFRWDMIEFVRNQAATEDNAYLTHLSPTTSSWISLLRKWLLETKLLMYGPQLPENL